MKLNFLSQVQNLKNLSKIENTVQKYTKCLQDSGFRRELRMPGKNLKLCPKNCTCSIVNERVREIIEMI